MISGIITSIVYGNDNATITLQGRHRTVDIKFEEAFFANSPNFAGLFYLIDRLVEEYESVVFNGLGEVRRTDNETDLEIVVYKGEDFTINGLSLLSISANLAI